jgi:hypothetical protein
MSRERVNREALRQFLRENGVPQDKIAGFVSIAERFEEFLEASATPGEPKAGGPGRTRKPAPQGSVPRGSLADRDDVGRFSNILMKDGLNTWDNYLALARYGQFLKNSEVYAAVVELLDGSEVMHSLYEKLEALVGEKTRDEIFSGIDLPPLGIPSSEKPRVTFAVMERLEQKLDRQTCEKLLSGCLRRLADESYLDFRKKYLESKNLDEFLARRGRDYVALLEQIKKEGKLYFTQEITDEVIEFVRSNPAIAQGIREGSILYEIKIPYMTKEYLAETDKRMKRYYYCHCPWVRESIRTGEVDVSPTFCLCSAGFVKKPWEVALGQTLKAEVIESVLMGDSWCKIAIHLPEHALKPLPAK